MKYGLALEGGGAKGAYQIGVVKALIDNGYEFEIDLFWLYSPALPINQFATT